MVRGHILINPKAGQAKLFAGDGTLRHVLRCSNATVGPVGTNDPYGHYGPCPPGDYYAGEPQILDPPEVPYGFAFTPLLDPNGLEAAHGRAGIGLHGGGSASPNPFAPDQGLYSTEGCIRFYNSDNWMGTSPSDPRTGQLVKFIRFYRDQARAAGEDPDRAVRVTVAA